TLGKRPDAPGGVYIGFAGEETPDGIKLTQITPKSPALKAGLLVEDIIQHIDKKPIKALRQVQEMTKDKKPGDKLTLSVKRGKDLKEVVVTLEERPNLVTRPYSGWLGGQRENAQDQQ